MELSRREKAIILIATDRHNVHERAFQSREMVGEHSSSWGQPASVIYLAFPHTHTRPYIHRNTYTHFLRRYVGACVCVCECVSRSLPHSTHSITIINFPVELPTFSNIKASFTHHSQYLGLLLDKKNLTELNTMAGLTSLLITSSLRHPSTTFRQSHWISIIRLEHPISLRLSFGRVGRKGSSGSNGSKDPVCLLATFYRFSFKTNETFSQYTDTDTTNGFLLHLLISNRILRLPRKLTDEQKNILEASLTFSFSPARRNFWVILFQARLVEKDRVVGIA